MLTHGGNGPQDYKAFMRAQDQPEEHSHDAVTETSSPQADGAAKDALDAGIFYSLTVSLNGMGRSEKGNRKTNFEGRSRALGQIFPSILRWSHRRLELRCPIVVVNLQFSIHDNT